MNVIIERDERGYSVYSDGLKSGIIIGSGKSVAEAKEDFFNTLKEIKSTYPERGLSVPKELIDSTFEYSYDISSVLDELDCLNLTKFAKIAGVNSSLLRHYKRGDFAISSKQVGKIETALHNLGRKLMSVSIF